MTTKATIKVAPKVGEATQLAKPPAADGSAPKLARTISVARTVTPKPTVSKVDSTAATKSKTMTSTSSAAVSTSTTDVVVIDPGAKGSAKTSPEAHIVSCPKPMTPTTSTSVALPAAALLLLHLLQPKKMLVLPNKHLRKRNLGCSERMRKAGLGR